MDAIVITFLEVKVNTEIRDLGFIAIMVAIIWTDTYFNYKS